jgi:hypothetical protein
MTAEHVEPEVRLSQTLQVALACFFSRAYSKVLCEKAVTGKMITFGYDTHRRPALYMIPSRQNTEDSPRQVEYAVWMLERALNLTGPGVE